jgi:KilA-N domain
VQLIFSDGRGTNVVKNRNITVQGTEVAIVTRDEQDYISLTDMVKSFEGGSALIEQWLKNKDTVLFLGVWEQINNSSFNSLEFEGIKNEAGRNSFYLSAKKWIDAGQAENMRDTASLEQLVVLSNLESINAVLIHQGLPASERLAQLNAIAIAQMRSLIGVSTIKRLGKGSGR